MAAKVTKSKNYLDGLGKTLSTKMKAELKVSVANVESERERMKTQLDALAKKVRQPVTDWEADEKTRKEDIQTKITILASIGIDDYLIIEDAEVALELVGKTEIDHTYCEFRDEAKTAKALVVTQLSEKIQAFRKADADALAAKELDEAKKEIADLKAQLAAQSEVKSDVTEEKPIIETEKAEETIPETISGDSGKGQPIARSYAIGGGMSPPTKKINGSSSSGCQWPDPDPKPEPLKPGLSDPAKTEPPKSLIDEDERKVNSSILNSFVGGGVSVKEGKIAVTMMARDQVPHVKITYKEEAKKIEGGLEYNFHVETVTAGQPRAYADSYYEYKVTSTRGEHFVKNFCMNVLRKSYEKNDMPDAFSGQLVSFKKITSHNADAFGKEPETYSYKTTELYTG